MTAKDSNTGEKLLIASLIDGDREAYRHLIESYQENIIRVCKGFTGNQEDAEDLAQDVFIQLYKSASSLRGEARLSTWLYRVAVNKSLNYLRSAKARKTFDHRDVNEGM